MMSSVDEIHPGFFDRHFFVILCLLTILSVPLRPCFALDSTQTKEKDAQEIESLYERAVVSSKEEKTEENYSATTQLFMEAAAKGHAQSQYSLALRYLFGKGVAIDYKAAVGWLQKAAQQGVVEAKFSLGLRYMLGQGVDKNSDQALWWFGLAAKDGSKEAAYYLDYVRAQNNVVSAQLDVARKYLSGEGVEKNDAKAVYWLQKAAAGGAPAAQFQLAEMYASGSGIDLDRDEAEHWYKEAARNGELRSFVKLADHFIKNGGKGADLVQAYAWLLLASEAQDQQVTARINDLAGKLTDGQVSEAFLLAAKLKKELGITTGAKTDEQILSAPPAKRDVSDSSETVPHQDDFAAFEDSLGADDFELTLPDYRKTLEMNPGDPTAYKNLALFYAREGFSDQALLTVQALITLQPDVAEHRVLLAKFYVEQQKSDLALAEYMQAVRFNPGLASAFVAMADIFMKKDEYVAAWVAASMAESLGYKDKTQLDVLNKLDKKFKTSASLILGQTAMHLRQVVVLSRQEAEMVLEELSHGADFTELVAAHSLAPFRANGGYLGFFEEKELAPAVVRAVKKLPPLQLSSIVASDAGFHIFQKIPVLESDSAFFH